jgi:hypothetical protein
MKDGQTGLSEAGIALCTNIRLNDTSTTPMTRPDEDLIKKIVLSSPLWLNERLTKTQQELNADSDYVAGKRLADSLHKEIIRNKQGEEGEVSERDSDSLYKAILGKSKAHIYTNEEQINLDKLLGETVPVPPPSFNHEEFLGKILPKTELENAPGEDENKVRGQSAAAEDPATTFRKEFFGYDPFDKKLSEQPVDKLTDQPISEFKKMDKLFHDLLSNEQFLKANPNFLEKLVECNTSSNRTVRLLARQEFYDMIRSAYPEKHNEHAVPSQKIAIARLDLLAYNFAIEHFATHDTLGSMSKEEFQKQLPTLAYKVFADNIKIAHYDSFNRYLFSLHEQRARLIQDAFETIIETNDIRDRPQSEDYKMRDFNNGRVLIPALAKDGKEKPSQQMEMLHQAVEQSDFNSGENTGLDGATTDKTLYSEKRPQIQYETEPQAHYNPMEEVAPAPVVRRISFNLSSRDLPETINEFKLQQSMAQLMLIQRMQQAANESPNESGLNIKESGGIPDGYMPSHDYDEVVDRTTNEQDDTNGGDDVQRLQDRSDGKSEGQQPGETARLSSKEELASMPDKKENRDTTQPQTQAPTQPMYDAAQQMEAFRLQAEKNRMMRKKPLGE